MHKFDSCNSLHTRTFFFSKQGFPDSVCVSSPRTKNIFSFAILATIKSNGFWAPWAPWTACVLTDANDCSTGKQTRNRVCIGPEAGGEACVGSLTDESRFCGLEHCVSCKYQFSQIVFAFLMQISLSTYLLTFEHVV